IRYLLLLPPGMDPDAAELFGFFVYEVRVGHDCSRWSTAQARFGLPLRVVGVQHPAPQLRCSAFRDKDAVVVTAPFASPVLNGQNTRPAAPATAMFALLYAQVIQADGKAWRNILLNTVPAPPRPRHRERQDARFTQAAAIFPQDEILRRLRILGLPL